MSANTEYIKESVKLKRSVSDHTMADESLIDTSNCHCAGRHSTKAIPNVSKTRPYTSESHTNNASIIAILERIRPTS